MSLDVRYMELLTKGPFETKKDEKNAKLASSLLWLRKWGNTLLCSMLIINAASNATAAIIMSEITNETVGFAISFTVILVSAEILP